MAVFKTFTAADRPLFSYREFRRKVLHLVHYFHLEERERGAEDGTAGIEGEDTYNVVFRKGFAKTYHSAGD